MTHDIGTMLAAAVLWLLAVYHVTMGAAALFAPSTAARLVRALYGAALPDDGAFRYAVSMLGALALVVGGLAAVAARAPNDNHPIVLALLALQLCRAFCRIRDRALLARAFGITPARNTAAIAALAAESIVLTLALR